MSKMDVSDVSDADLDRFEKKYGIHRTKAIRRAKKEGKLLLMCARPSEGLYFRTYDPNRKLSEKEIENQLRFTKERQCARAARLKK